MILDIEIFTYLKSPYEKREFRESRRNDNHTLRKEVNISINNRWGLASVVLQDPYAGL